MNDKFKQQLETNGPFSKGALMVEKRYHSGRKAELGDVPLFAFMPTGESGEIVMEMIHKDDLHMYEIVDDKQNPPVIKLK